MKTVCPNLVELYEGVLKVLQISLEGLTKFLPVVQRTSMDGTGVPQVSQLRSDPRLCLRDTNTYNAYFKVKILTFLLTEVEPCKRLI